MRADARLLLRDVWFVGHERPRLFAGYARGDMCCRGCGKEIKAGALEYEIVGSASSLVLDAACARILMEEMRRQAGRESPDAAAG